MTNQNKNKEKGGKSQMVKSQNEVTKSVTVTTDFAKLTMRTFQGKTLAPIRGVMKLTEKDGHIYTVRKNKAITAAGYKHLNKVASVNIVTPQTISVDGVEKPNPAIERDPLTKAIETVNVRKIGIGFSPIGNIVIIDKTLFYNIYTYLIQDIQAKMEKEEWKTEGGKPRKTGKLLHPDLGVIGQENSPPEKKGSWLFFPTMKPLGIWLNYDDSAASEIISGHTQRQRFGDRIAQKIVERNILKDHPAIGIEKINVKDGVADVPVYGWRHPLGSDEIDLIKDQAEKGEAVDIKKEEIIDVEPEEEQAEKEDAVQDENGKPLFPGDPATTNPEKQS